MPGFTLPPLLDSNSPGQGDEGGQCVKAFCQANVVLIYQTTAKTQEYPHQGLCPHLLSLYSTSLYFLNLRPCKRANYSFSMHVVRAVLWLETVTQDGKATYARNNYLQSSTTRLNRINRPFEYINHFLLHVLGEVCTCMCCT